MVFDIVCEKQVNCICVILLACDCVTVNQLGSEGIAKIRSLLSSADHLTQLHSLRLCSKHCRIAFGTCLVSRHFYT